MNISIEDMDNLNKLSQLIVDDLLNKIEPKELTKLKKFKEGELITLHDSFGRHIRNEYCLWKRPWTPRIENGVDFSEEHPDQVSYEIIKKLWKTINQ